VSSTPSAPDRDDAGFEEAWRVAEPIPGWLTRDQARMLWDEALCLAPAEVALEIGSHQGRSAIVLAHALRQVGARLLAMDPFVEGRLFGGAPTRTEFERNLRTAGVTDVVDLIPEYSTRARPGWDRPLHLLYIDGKHDYWTLSDDLRWSVHLRPGDAVLVHDAFSSIGVTLGLLLHALPSARLRYERRTGSLALFRVAPPRAVDRLRIVREIPWWLRNVGIKVLLRFRLRTAARWFGHDSPYDPY
jgi:hypothetical protein